jgi:hypothetical protein
MSLKDILSWQPDSIRYRIFLIEPPAISTSRRGDSSGRRCLSRISSSGNRIQSGSYPPTANNLNIQKRGLFRKRIFKDILSWQPVSIRYPPNRAASNLNIQKRGLFRKKMSLKDILSWQPDSSRYDTASQ